MFHGIKKTHFTGTGISFSLAIEKSSWFQTRFDLWLDLVIMVLFSLLSLLRCQLHPRVCSYILICSDTYILTVYIFIFAIEEISKTLKVVIAY